MFDFINLFSRDDHSEEQISNIIKKLAKENNTSPEYVRKEIQKCIDIAWESSDSQTILLQNRLFPKGKPTIEKFLSVLANEIKNQ